MKIYRLISKNSIEEAMLRCAEKKLKLEMDVTGYKQKGAFLLQFIRVTVIQFFDTKVTVQQKQIRVVQPSEDIFGSQGVQSGLPTNILVNIIKLN